MFSMIFGLIGFALDLLKIAAIGFVIYWGGALILVWLASKMFIH